MFEYGYAGINETLTIVVFTMQLTYATTLLLLILTGMCIPAINNNFIVFDLFIQYLVGNINRCHL
jgi:hypothetical protein